MTSVEAQGTASQTRHVVVIGAGTVGSCCAWYLRRAGFEVTVIDSELPGQSTSFGNAGCITPWHILPYSYPGVSRQVPGWLLDSKGPLFIRWKDFPGLLPWFWRFWRSGTSAGVKRVCNAQARLMKRASADFGHILAGIDAGDMRKAKGVIAFYNTREDFEAERWKFDVLDEYGFEWQHLGPAELKIMVPELEIGTGVAVFHPDCEHVLDPGALTARIAEACFADGGNWLQDRVRRVQSSDQGISLGTESGREIGADALVVAAGVWSNRLAGQLDYAVPMIAKRGYHCHLGNPGIGLDYPVASMSHAFVVTPMQSGIRVAGTAEFAALDAEPDYERAKVLLEHAQRYLPGLRSNQVEEWMGQRPMMADSVPVISPSPVHANVFYAFGHGHYGLTQGPTTGRIITALVSGNEPEVDIEDYRFGRFRD